MKPEMRPAHTICHMDCKNPQHGSSVPNQNPNGPLTIETGYPPHSICYPENIGVAIELYECEGCGSQVVIGMKDGCMAARKRDERACTIQTVNGKPTEVVDCTCNAQDDLCQGRLVATVPGTYEVHHAMSTYGPMNYGFGTGTRRFVAAAAG